MYESLQKVPYPGILICFIILFLLNMMISLVLVTKKQTTRPRLKHSLLSPSCSHYADLRNIVFLTLIHINPVLPLRAQTNPEHHVSGLHPCSHGKTVKQADIHKSAIRFVGRSQLSCLGSFFKP